MGINKVIRKRGGRMISFDNNNKIKAREVVDVFKSVGIDKDEKNIVQAFGDSYYITAYDGKRLIGFVRALTDYYYYAVIYDFVVHKDYQRRGIGSFMLKEIINNFEGLEITVVNAKGLEKFLLESGFEDDDRVIFLKK